MSIPLSRHWDGCHVHIYVGGNGANLVHVHVVPEFGWGSRHLVVVAYCHHP